MKNVNPVTQEITQKLALLDFQKRIEPVNAILPGNKHCYLERISDTTQYLSSLRKLIYDVEFVDLYFHDGKIPGGCFVADNMVLRITSKATTNEPEEFLRVLSLTQPLKRGVKFYLDHDLYAEHVSFIKSDSLRDSLLKKRREGKLFFSVLWTIDQAGNVTKYLASDHVQLKMAMIKQMNEQLVEA